MTDIMVAHESHNNNAASLYSDAPQLLWGMKDIAAYFEIPARKAYYLAANGLLPGVFRIGSGYVLDRAVAKEGLRVTARAGIKGAM